MGHFEDAVPYMI